MMTSFLPSSEEAPFIPFADVASTALADIDAVLMHYLPGGKRQGQEYIAFNPTRRDEHLGSFSVNLKHGKWSDFATGESGGDLIALVAYLKGCDQKEAARELAEFLGIRTATRNFGSPLKAPNLQPAKEDWSLVLPLPEYAPALPSHPRWGRHGACWTYRDEQGRALFHVTRFDPTGERKQVLPLTLWRDSQNRLHWQWKALPEPRPLYGLEKLAARPHAPVMVCEGEKAAEAAQRLLPDYVCITSVNGAQAAHKSDWQPLANRTVILWPDADEEGLHYARQVSELAAQAPASAVYLLDIGDFQKASSSALPAGFDAADFEIEGWDRSLLQTAIPKAQSTKHQSPEGAWPPLLPIQAARMPVPPFDAQALLPPVLGDWVMDEAERMSCPPDYIAAPLLVMLGSLIGTHCAIKPKAHDHWLIVPNLWGLIVGDPSAKKSPALDVVLKLLDPLNEQAAKNYEAASRQYQLEQNVFDSYKTGLQDQLRRSAKTGKKPRPTGEERSFDELSQELQAHCQQAPKAPALKRYKTDDPTVEKLGEILRDNPIGLLVARDEIVGLLAGWEKEGHQGDRAFFLEAWNGTRGFDVDRVGRGHIPIPNLCVSLLGGIQPDKLLAYMRKAAHALANDGMLQRFQLMLYPDPGERLWLDRAPGQAARLAVQNIVQQLSELNPVSFGASTEDECSKFPSFRFSEEAQRIFVCWWTELHRERLQLEELPIVRQHLCKFEKLFPALALIFHLTDCIASGARGPVSAAAAIRAAAWCDYLHAHARRCYSLLQNENTGATAALQAKLQQGELQYGFTLRDIRQKQWSELTHDQAIQIALAQLEKAHWLKGERVGGNGPGSGRPTTRYHIHPSLRRKASSGEPI